MRLAEDTLKKYDGEITGLDLRKLLRPRAEAGRETMDMEPAETAPGVSAAGAAAVRESLDSALIIAAEKAREVPWSVITSEDYALFSRTGNRVIYEELNFSRRRKINALVMGELAEGKGRFTGAIFDGLKLILDEASWCLPAHYPLPPDTTPAPAGTANSVSEADSPRSRDTAPSTVGTGNNAPEAHNPRPQDTAQRPYPDPEKPIIDLFAAETGALTAIIASLPQLTGEGERERQLRARTDAELEKRIFAPYLGEHFWWMGNGVDPMCNWTSWCTQNILLAFGLRKKDDAALLKKVAEKAARSVDYLLDEYAPDGYCTEGAQYYGHAGLTIWGCLELLHQMTGGAMAGGAMTGGAMTGGAMTGGAMAGGTMAGGAMTGGAMAGSAMTGGAMTEAFADERLSNIAAYIRRVYVGGDYYFNFADCSAIAGRRGVREYLFGLCCHDTKLAAFAVSDYARQDMAERLMPEEINLWYHLLQAKYHEEMLGGVSGPGGEKEEKAEREKKGQKEKREEKETAEREKKAEQEKKAEREKKELSAGCGTGCATEGKRLALKPDLYENSGNDCFPDAGVIIGRDAHFALAAKAGSNGDSHNHNDVGSVILYGMRDGEAVPVLIDLGVGTYTKKTFSARRYEIWTMQSQYHNLPTFHDGDRMIQQRDGKAYAAADIEMDVTEEHAYLTSDLAGAYDDPGVRKYVRSVRMDCGRGITVRDEYDGDYRCVLSLMTYDEPVIRGNHISIADVCTIEVTGAGTITTEVCRIEDDRLAQAWKHDCHRILIEMDGNITELAIHCPKK